MYFSISQFYIVLTAAILRLKVILWIVSWLENILFFVLWAHAVVVYLYSKRAKFLPNCIKHKQKLRKKKKRKQHKETHSYPIFTAFVAREHGSLIRQHYFCSPFFLHFYCRANITLGFTAVKSVLLYILSLLWNCFYKNRYFHNGILAVYQTDTNTEKLAIT